MSPKKYIKNIDETIGKNWKLEKEKYTYEKSEVDAATVLSRLDIALASSLLAYNAQMLYSIRLGVWVLVAITLTSLFISS